jgi:Integrase core domain.
MEIAVDVRSYCHSAFRIGDTETFGKVIRVIEEHIVKHGPPLGILADHGSDNLSSETLSYLHRKGIELVPAGPGNPKGITAPEINILLSGVSALRNVFPLQVGVPGPFNS